MFLQIARLGQNTWWRYLLSLVVVTLGVLAGQMPIFLYLLAKGYKDFEISEMAETLNFEKAGVGQNATLFFMLLAFVGGLIGAGLAWLAFDGYRAATLNWASFSAITFAFDVNLKLLAEGIFFAMLIGLVGGLFPAVRAARQPVAHALREL